MDKKDFDVLFDVVQVTVAELCCPFVTLTENGIRVCICEKDVSFTIEELLAAKSSAKDFVGLIKKRIWEGK